MWGTWSRVVRRILYGHHRSKLFYRRCLNCRGLKRVEGAAVKALLKCDICKKQLSRDKFGATALHNRSNALQALRCIQCSNPPCTNPICPTCKRCRDVKCKKGLACTATIATLNPKYVTKSKKGVDEYRCEKCAGVQCDICLLRLPRDRFSDHRSRSG